MSELKIEVCKILEINPHPNADRLVIAKIKGWDVIIKKDIMNMGDLVAFIPPDSILTKTLQEFLGITNYCAELPKSNPLHELGSRRVKATRLRGVASYGTVMTIKDVEKYFELEFNGDISDRLVEGSDLSAVLNIRKYEPPVRATAGDAEVESPMFHKYIEIENWRNYPNVFKDGDQVVITQKIHGSNCRIGYCLDTKDGQWKIMAGSHKVRRKEGLYWTPLEMYPQLVDMIMDIYSRNSQQPVVVFGEIFGDGIQDITYGLTNGKKDFRIFDISVGGKYMSWPFMNGNCSIYKIPTVPLLYIGPYSEDVVKQNTDGEAFAFTTNAKFKGREGCVIKSYLEEEDPYFGRKILKSVSVDYLDRANAQDNE